MMQYFFMRYFSLWSILCIKNIYGMKYDNKIFQGDENHFVMPNYIP